MSTNVLARPARGAAIAAIIISVLLLIVFLGSGLAKLTAQPMVLTMFAAFGYPAWFMYVVGALEVIAAILIVVPRTSRLGAAIIIGIMIGALITHLAHGQVSMIAGPATLLILAVVELRLRGGFSAPLITSSTKERS
jgi:uncharacterized membrane protein YphA (DoxX/SURF4 family)